MVKIGEAVGDFEVDAFHDGKLVKIRLSDYRGKWLVLFFYPADFTFVCPTELGELADYYDKIRQLGAEVMSVSTDTHYTHLAWHMSSPQVGKVKFPMLADPAGKLGRHFGVYIEDEGITLRGTFIINPEGKLVAAEVNDNSIGRSAKELLRKLQAAKHVYENGGVVACPASWEPGKSDLRPSASLVGKI